MGWKAAIAGLIVACGPESPEVQLESEVIEVACGHCVYDLPDTEYQGCPWTTQVEGEYYLISGPVPQDHHKHDPDGICSMPRQARVQGYVHDEYFVATEFELLPAESVPEPGSGSHAHDHDH